jgi:hypothetical protein
MADLLTSGFSKRSPYFYSSLIRVMEKEGSFLANLTERRKTLLDGDIARLDAEVHRRIAGADLADQRVCSDQLPAVAVSIETRTEKFMRRGRGVDF